MRVLCGYSKLMQSMLPELKDSDPRLNISDHDIVIARSYGDVSFHMTNTAARLPTFDIVLLDIYMPWSLNSTESMPTVLLSRHINEGLIRGMGFFVPPFFQSEFNFYDDIQYYAAVADQTCWTWNDERDWEKLMNLVLSRIEER